MLVDTHCHLDFPEFDNDRDEVIKRAKASDIGYIINIGSSLEGSRKSIALANQYEFIYATVGIHPHQADRVSGETENISRDLAIKSKVVAIGEIGLDYYRNYSKAESQKSLFISLLKLAQDLELPAVIHNRQAQEDTLKILKEMKQEKVVVHCFSGNKDFLKDCLDLDFFISFTCNITYRKADNLRELVKITPLDKLLLETDAPFLPPEGFRGRRNEPLYIKYLAEEIAKIKQVNLGEVIRVTSDNAKSFFNLG